jgi:hypothetical protein
MEVRRACIDQLGADRVFPLSYEEFTDEEASKTFSTGLAEFLDIPANFTEGKFSKATPDSLKTPSRTIRRSGSGIGSVRTPSTSTEAGLWTRLGG